MSRLSDAFRTPVPNRLVTYVAAGDPDRGTSAGILRALAASGADVIEVGVPFSDPIADGPTIQRAAERALAGGATLSTTLDLIEDVRPDVDAPIVLFTYVNPVVRLGMERFVSRAASAGVDAVLLLDLPIEESAETTETLARGGVDQIFLVSPTTTDARLKEAGRLGRGFLYAISRLGVTGARANVAASAAPLVGRIRRATSLPIALGFGVSTPDHVREVTGFADAAVVGSALVDVIARAHAQGQDAAAAAGAFVAWLKGDTKGLQ